MSQSFKVAEVFGPTIQGEGPLAGAVSHFIRFGGCDYGCRWCDSAHAVDPAQVRLLPKLDLDEIMAKVEVLPPARWVTLSGGNPALWDLAELVEYLHLANFHVAVETQGTIWKPWLADVDQLTISPKPPSSEMNWLAESKSFMSSVNYDNEIALKVPVWDRLDFEWAVELHQRYRYAPFYLSIVTAMGGLRGDFAGGAIDETEDVLERYRMVADWVLKEPAMADVKVIPQLHVLLWGSLTRGV